VVLNTNAVDTVSLSTFTGFVEVVNVDAGGYLTFTVDGKTPAAVGAANQYVVPASIGGALIVPCPNVQGVGTKVSIIGSASCRYQVGVVSS
jgi:hypothetical protein